jgi:hypothetical protein
MEYNIINCITAQRKLNSDKIKLYFILWPDNRIKSGLAHYLAENL